MHVVGGMAIAMIMIMVMVLMRIMVAMLFVFIMRIVLGMLVLIMPVLVCIAGLMGRFERGHHFGLFKGTACFCINVEDLGAIFELRQGTGHSLLLLFVLGGMLETNDIGGRCFELEHEILAFRCDT